MNQNWKQTKIHINEVKATPVDNGMWNTLLNNPISYTIFCKLFIGQLITALFKTAALLNIIKVNNSQVETPIKVDKKCQWLYIKPY